MNKKNTSSRTRTSTSKANDACSTPEHRRNESPARDSDGFCDSDMASPDYFLSSQDVGVGWSDNTPKSGKFLLTRVKSSTPLSSKHRKPVKPKIIESPIPKRRPFRTQKNSKFYQQLIEINKNLPIIKNVSKSNKEKSITNHNEDEEDIFSNSDDLSPKCEMSTGNHCIGKNIQNTNSINFDTGLDFDDSINEVLLKASQKVEEKILKCELTPAKRGCYGSNNYSPDRSTRKLNMDSISGKFESPVNQNIGKTKKYESPGFNDSFEVGFLNDTALDSLIQKPLKSVPKNNEAKCNNQGSPSSCGFLLRHSSMPESPVTIDVKPSTSNLGFNRYKSMPQDKDKTGITSGPDCSPPSCTPEEIKRKHQLARERLLAKRQLPFTKSTQQNSQVLTRNQSQTQLSANPKKVTFQPKIPSNKDSTSKTNLVSSTINNNTVKNVQEININADLKSIIEKKRQEALLKLRRRQEQRIVKK